MTCQRFDNTKQVFEASKTTLLSSTRLNAFDPFSVGVAANLVRSLGVLPDFGPIISYRTEDGIDPAFKIAVATLAMGNINVGDDLIKTNWAELQRCCSLDGIILRPDSPLSFLLSDFGFEQSLADAPMENVKLTAGTVTEISGAVVDEFQTNIILAYKLNQES